MSRIKTLVALAIMIVVVDTAAVAAKDSTKGIPFKVASDSRARYFLLDVVPGKNGNIIATTRREGFSGTRFSRREINCLAWTFRYVGEGDTLKQASRTNYNVGKMSELVDGSISDVAVKFACSRRR